MKNRQVEWFRLFILISILSILPVLGLAGCSSESTSASNAPQVEVTLTDFKIAPDPIRVPAGAVTLKVVNNGAQPHNFIVELPKQVESELLQPGASRVLTFTVKEKGTFTVHCNVAGHREMGMEGKLVVE